MNEQTQDYTRQMGGSHEDYREGSVARSIEQQTAKIPSDAFLWAAVGAMAASATLQIMRRQQVSNFVGQWAPTFLILGLYNKLVKQLGSDRMDPAHQMGR